MLKSVRPFSRFDARGIVWPDGYRIDVDAVIWCTGYRPDLEHLSGLSLTMTNCHPAVRGTQSVDEPRLWLVGYGEWTGFGSATLIGVQRYAKATIAEVASANLSR